MLKRIPFFVLACLCHVFCFGQTSSHVVISQVYGGGGNTGSTFRSDFVELYNPTGTTVSLAGWSLQYAAKDGNFENATKTNLSGEIAPGKYFLVRLKTGTNGAVLPNADFSPATLIDLAQGSGKVALVANTALIVGSCNPGSGIVDFLGYGSAECFEGTDGTPVLSSTSAAHRKNNGCQDTDDNEGDFYEQAPNPRNSQSAGHSCSVRLSVNSVSAQPFCINGLSGAAGTVSYTANTALSGTLNAYLSDANGGYTNAILIGTATASGTGGTINVNIPSGLPSGTGYRIRVDATNPQVYGQESSPVDIINGARNVSNILFTPTPSSLKVLWQNPAGCYDEMMVVVKNGSAINGIPSGNGAAYTADLAFGGAGSAFDGGQVAYKGTQSGQTVTGLTAGQSYHVKVFTRRGNDWSPGIEAVAKPRELPNPGAVVINQFNPGYSASNANFEYVELVNNTGSSIDLSELAIRYQSPTTGNQGVAGGALSGILPPHGYWLLSGYPAASPTETVSVGISALQRDGNMVPGMGAGAGQFALVRLTDNQVLDAVRYGNVSAGSYLEGAPLAALSGNRGYKRKADGVDHDDNGADFVVVENNAIDLRNSRSRLAREGAEIESATDLKRIYVTGNAKITGAVTLTEKLVLQSGKLSLDNNDLTAAAITGGNAASYVQTNGTGRLAIPWVAAALVLFPVGQSTYNPLTITQGGGLAWQVGVTDGVAAANGGGAVQRTWNITPSATPSTGATITFQYDEGDPTQLGALYEFGDKVQVFHFHDNSWQKAGEPQEPGGVPDGIRTATITNWTRFSPFVINTAAQGPLPVKFSGLRLYQDGNDVVLAFTVHNETGVDHYAIESSADGVRYEQRALLEPRNNAGATVQYSFRDGRPLAGDRYYRVRGVEQDGVASFSAVVKARGKVQSPALAIAPNPVVGGHLQYSVGNLAAGNYEYRVYNSVGQVVYTGRLVHGGGWMSGSLALPELKSGWYLLELAGPQPMKQTFLVR